MRTFDGSITKQPGVRQLKHAAGIKEPQNAVHLLRADHREVEALFTAYKKCESATEQQSLAKKICATLMLHMRLEEEIFYPAFIQATGHEQLYNEALVEHQVARKLMDEVEAGAEHDPLFDAKVKVLSELIKHHVKEEERFNGMFTKARVARMDLRALGIVLEARKQELTQPPA